MRLSREIYDVIIAGASFAGLSVASRLQAKVLLIDRFDIGTYQISACGTPYDVVKELGCENSVLQICDIFSFHVNGKRIDCRFKNPYCTIDFAKFCRQLNSKNKANFLKASVINIEQGELFKVFTSNGSFLSKYVVDATGYRASIAKLLKRCYVHNDALSFGIETEVPYRTKDFHFFYEPSFIKDGVAWLFPCGEFSRFGVASYKGETKLLDKLDLFLQRYNLKRQKVHGGFFCYCFKEPVVENVFVVGCAQGQTLPLTGEGIRRCIFFGIKCGEIIQRILDRRINLNEGINEYSNLALKARRDFNFLLAAQNRLLKMSEKNIELSARIISNRLIFPFLERHYREI